MFYSCILYCKTQDDSDDGLVLKKKRKRAAIIESDDEDDDNSLTLSQKRQRQGEWSDVFIHISLLNS